MKIITSGMLLLLGGFATSAILLLPDPAQAIPAFTRQFKTECFTCHTIFPELTEQGDNFRRNGYVWLETKGTAKPAAKKDEKKDGKKGLNEREYLVLSSLPDYVPLSIIGTFNASYADNRPENEGNRFDLATRAVVLDAGGSFNDKMGAWISYNLFSEGMFNHVTGGSALNANVPSNNIPDINEAFVQARHLFDSPVNVKVGRFTPTLSLWKTTNKTSLASPMATTSYRVGDSPFYVNAATDGAELNSILGGRLAVAAGMVKVKDQRNLSGYGSIQYKLGGADFEGHEAAVNMDAEESIFDYLTVTLGGYGYAGSNNPGAFRQLNNFYRYGFEGDVRYQKYRVKLASAFGTDDNSLVSNAFPNGGQWINKNSQVYAAEALYLFGSQFIPSFRFEYEDNGTTNTRRYIPTLAYAALQNAKLVLEYKRENTSGNSMDNNTVNLALTATF
ncbi:MAG TPA: hypothetical protein VN642_09310 [Dongiaceae bacterium]|nr:hypothetical protein [Dongiaceae bacterium]